MEKPFSAYTGTDDYIFACYAHHDAEIVYADLVQLKDAGINIWYDEGIPAGTAWRGEIANAIRSSSKLIFFISASSLNSNHCLREVDYALNHDIEILPVYLEDAALPPELDLVFNRVQAIYREKDPRYMERLNSALQARGGVAMFVPRVRRNKFGGMITLIAAVIILGASLLWLRDPNVDIPAQASSQGGPDPTAFDLYLEGMDLLERWYQEGNIEEAVRRFEGAGTLDPTFSLTFARKAEALRIRYVLTGNEGFLQEAVDSVNEAVRLNPGLAPVQVALGRIYAMQGNMDLAFAALEKALQIDPNDATANAVIGSLYDRQGRLEDAEAAYSKSLALEPENVLNIDSFANFLYRQSRFQEAARQWQKIVRLTPDNYTALSNLGSALSQSGNVAEAITMYQRALQLRPNYMTWNNLGSDLVRAGRLQEAVDAYENALQIDETDWLAWGNLAYTLSKLTDRRSEAEDTFNHAILLAEEARETNPRDPFVHSDLGLYYAKTGRYDLALERMETAMALSPNTSEIIAAAAEVFELAGDRDKAVEMVLQALDLGFPRFQLLANSDISGLMADPRLL